MCVSHWSVPLVPWPRSLHVQAGGHPLGSGEGEAASSLVLSGRLRAELSSRVLGSAAVLGLPVTASADDGAPEAPGAYRLRVDASGATIQASSRAGRLHGLHTLCQLLAHHQGDGHLPAYVIEDLPALAVRGLHVCYHLITEFMPDLAPSYEALLERIRLMGQLKANLLLLEIESLFPYERHPAIVSRLAFTKEQWRQVAALCAEEEIEIVLLVQCLGHAYNVLRHRQYAHLREVPGTTQQYCPSNSAVQAFYLELIDELRETFGALRRVHVGGDESRRLGVCRTCSAKVREHGLGRLYGEHVGAICQGLLDRGLTPLVWADIIEHAPDAAAYLPQGATLVYWNYNMLGGWNRPPAFDMLAETGHPVITASGARFGTHNHTMYLYSAAMSGIGVLTRETERRGLEGTLVTDWMKAVPYELAEPSLAYGLDQAWNPQGSLDDFERRYARLAYGLPDTLSDDLARAYRLLEALVPFLEDAQTHLIDRLDRYDLSGLTVRERIIHHAAQDRIDDSLAQLAAAEERGREALALAEQLCGAAGDRTRELALLRLSAATQVHKARMGQALLTAARLLRYPTPDDAAARDATAATLRALAGEWAVLADETRALLGPGTFPEVVEEAVRCKFEPEARDLLLSFAERLARGEIAVRLF